MRNITITHFKAIVVENILLLCTMNALWLVHQQENYLFNYMID
jgi:hypothetical protein